MSIVPYVCCVVLVTPWTKERTDGQMSNTDQWGYVTPDAAKAMLARRGFTVGRYNPECFYHSSGATASVHWSGRIRIFSSRNEPLTDEAMTPADFDAALSLAICD